MSNNVKEVYRILRVNLAKPDDMSDSINNAVREGEEVVSITYSVNQIIVLIALPTSAQ